MEETAGQPQASYAKEEDKKWPRFEKYETMEIRSADVVPSV